jgi:hypothetical protein
VGVLVEGPCEKAVLARIEAYLRQNGLTTKTIVAHGRSKLIKDARKHCKLLREVDGCDKVIILLDQDEDPCVSGTVGLIDATTRLLTFVAVIVAQREIEAWLLADPEIAREIGFKKQIPDTGQLAKPSTELKEAYCKSKGWDSYSKTTLCSALSEKFDPTRAQTRNNSLKKFLETATS